MNQFLILGNLQQGLRRLQRSYKTSTVESSTANDESNESSSSECETVKRKPTSKPVTTLATKKSFNDIPSFPGHLDSMQNSAGKIISHSHKKQLPVKPQI